MTRAERRRLEKSTGKKATYNVTEEQLDLMIKERLEQQWSRLKQEVTNDAVDELITILFTLPMAVLMEDFWPKSYDKKIPKFTEKLLVKYNQYVEGEMDINELKDRLWNEAGIKMILED